MSAFPVLSGAQVAGPLASASRALDRLGSPKLPALAELVHSWDEPQFDQDATSGQDAAGFVTETTITSTAPVADVYETSQIALKIGVAGGNTPSGVVRLYANGSPLGAAPLVDGSALFRLPHHGALALPAGANVITAEYSGDATHAPSNSRYNLTVREGAAAPDFSLQADAQVQALNASSPTANFRLQFAAQTGLAESNRSVVLAYDAPRGLSCSGTPSTVAFNAKGYAAVTVQCGLAANYTIKGAQNASAMERGRWRLAVPVSALACLLLFWNPARRRRWQTMMSVLLATAVSFGLASCSNANEIANKAGGKPPNSQSVRAGALQSGGVLAPGKYNVLVTASVTSASSATAVVHLLPLEVVVE